MDEDRKVALNLRDIPADLRNRFKSVCSRSEKSMTGVIVAFMRRVVEGRENVTEDQQKIPA